MGFASGWLSERALFPEYINESPDEDTGIIVVVPAYNETGITRLLDSFSLCEKPVCSVEVIVVVNAPGNADIQILNTNKQCQADIESWKKHNSGCFFRLFSVNVTDPLPRWGVGLARKTGMDEAARRFDRIDKPEGVIVNLDADCLVAPGYFISIEKELLENPDHRACSIFFEHPLSGSSFPQKNYSLIALYELHLRYFLQGIKYAGHPFAFHTVGSAVAVKALAYIRSGGMNRRQAGEDFYFIQKLIPAGGYFALNSTTVYPSPRVSLRVPFGTGATIAKLSEENSNEFPTYNLSAFEDLRSFFDRIDTYFRMKFEESENEYMNLPVTVKLCLGKDEFTGKMLELKSNTSKADSFRKRFFTWFNMFRIVKFMNAVHREIYGKVPVNTAATELLKKMGVDCRGTSAEILMIYRELDRKQSGPEGVSKGTTSP